MKKISIIAAITMSMAGIAHAEWTGLYAGVNAEYVFNHEELKSQQLGFTAPSENYNTSSDFSTFSSGGQLGYVYQFPNTFVTGIEAGVSFNANQKNTLNSKSEFNSDVYDRFALKDRMQASIKGRVGRALSWNNNNLLPYLTAGASFADLALTYKNEGGDHYSQSTTRTGWLIGAGMEWAFMQNWSVRAEYYYVDYGNAIELNIPSVYGLVDTNGNARVNLSSNNIAVAVNYWA